MSARVTPHRAWRSTRAPLLPPLLLLLVSTAAAASLAACRDEATRDARDPCGASASRVAESRSTPRVTTIAVNRGTHGMLARARWMLSPDRCALLVVEDPASVENDPLPNGFVLATERDGGAVVQRDSVWDVAPSPDWTRLAYSRAYALPGAERDSVSASEWAALARRAGLDADAVRRGAFATSGMTTAYAVGRPVIVTVGAAAAAGDSTAERALAMAGAWRVRWTRDGRSLVVGGKPLRTADDAPPTQWDVVDAGTPAARSASERAQSLGGDVARADAEWTAGPTIDVSAANRLDSAAAIAVDAGTIESRAGRVWLRPRDAGRPATDVGPGVALAATRGGRFVVALAPDTAAARSEPKERLVVYRVDR